MNFSTPTIPDISQPRLANSLQQKLDNKTKPMGSLGRIEALAQRIGLILGTETPALDSPQLVVFAADHGLAARGVSAYPSDVTWQMVENFLSGGAAVSLLARQHGIGLTVVDCGVRHDFGPRAGLLNRKIAAGTADALAGPAMTEAQCDQALSNGAELLRSLPGNALLLGEMGIGNTSAASLLMSRLAGLDIADCTGSGTGLDAEAVQRKIGILQKVLAHHATAQTPLQVLQAFGGFEIATMVGAVLQAAHERRVVVVDGFIASAAVMVASALQPGVLQRCVFAHRSGERGHALMLAHLKAEPLLDLGLRLGEGSGAAMAWPLLQSACAILCHMASFESAGVSRQENGSAQEMRETGASPSTASAIAKASSTANHNPNAASR
jgi:nicotinate-nucleotide--dimethylbenzimidazole phosphoribosyltransferase